MAKTQGQLYFGVKARHVRQLGRELVANRTTALAELVKNAHDADATIVHVVFHEPEEGGVLEIRDNGAGMSLDGVRANWMQLSTDHKERHRRSPRYGRAIVGRKGIGRFATETLGRRLTLSTTVEGEPSWVIATFDWQAFEGPGLDLDAVPCEYRIEPAEDAAHGTTLLIEGLHERWTERKLREVRKSLLLLQPPFPLAYAYQPRRRRPAAADPGFQVQFGLGRDVELANVWSSAAGRFLEAATAVVEGEVGDDGRGRWRVRSERLGLDLAGRSRRKLAAAGPFELRASYFVYERRLIGDEVGLRLARQMGGEYGGIRLYRDGMRIPPYGDPGNDWLLLDASSRRREVDFPIANHHWFGHVALSHPANDAIVDTASREGVIENEAFEELRQFVAEALADCARKVFAHRDRRPQRRRAEAPRSRSEIVDLALRRAEVAIAHALEGRHDEARLELDQASRRAATAARRADAAALAGEAALLDELAVLRALAGLGASVAVFGHEVHAHVQAVVRALGDMREDVGMTREPWRSSLLRSATAALEAVQRLEETAHYVDEYATFSQRRELEAQPLHEILWKFTSVYGKLLAAKDIRIDWSAEPPHVKTLPMARAELEAILVHLLINAVEALDGLEKGERRISIVAEETAGELVIRFQDSGRGVDPKVRETLFDAFVSAGAAGAGHLGWGAGLGLKIVRDIVEAYQGTIAVGHPDRGFRTCFELRLPRADQAAERRPPAAAGGAG